MYANIHHGAILSLSEFEYRQKVLSTGGDTIVMRRAGKTLERLDLATLMRLAKLTTGGNQIESLCLASLKSAKLTHQAIFPFNMRVSQTKHRSLVSKQARFVVAQDCKVDQGRGKD